MGGESVLVIAERHCLDWQQKMQLYRHSNRLSSLDAPHFSGYENATCGPSFLMARVSVLKMKIARERADYFRSSFLLNARFAWQASQLSIAGITSS